MRYKITLTKHSIGWYKNDLYHRLCGPTVEYMGGTQYWCKNGERHRLSGPAVEYIDGGKLWYIDDIWYTKEEFQRIISGKK